MQKMKKFKKPTISLQNIEPTAIVDVPGRVYVFENISSINLNMYTHVMLLVLMALTELTSLSLLVLTAEAVWKLETLTTGLLLFVDVTVTFVDGEL